MLLKNNIITEYELHRLYIDERMATEQIGEFVGVSGRTIRNWIKLYNIPRRTLSEAHLDHDIDLPTEEALCIMYINNNMSAEKIGKSVGVNKITILRLMEKYNIQRRTLKEARSLLNISGPNSPSWTGGPKTMKYCYKFNQRFREAVRERDNYTCQNCGKTQEENDRKLAVHHVHYDAENCYPDVISLCKSCHPASNSNRDWWETHYMFILVGRGFLEWRPPWAMEE